MDMRTIRINRMVVAFGLIAALGLAGSVAFSADMGMMAASQLKTALEHAKLAQDADTVASVKVHLQHVVNCIEGPKGAMFNMGGGNPCQGQGNGILADMREGGSQYTDAIPWVETAGEIAAVGLHANTVERAKAAAWATHATLEHLGMMMHK